MFVSLNYGYLRIKRASNSSEPLVRASVRGIDGKEAIVQAYSADDLAFDSTSLIRTDGSQFCQSRSAKQKIFLIGTEWLHHIIIESQMFEMIVILLVIPLVFSVATSLIVAFISFAIYLKKGNA